MTSTQQAELDRAAERLAELRTLHQSRAAALRLHAEADLEVLTALSPLGGPASGQATRGLDATRP